jgi:Protein of unknown function (DUF3467)
MSAESPVPRYYVNAMGARGGPYDLALDFGQRVGADETEWQVRIVMSWEHARSMVDALQDVISKYEAELGEVRQVEEALQAQAEQSEKSS